MNTSQAKQIWCNGFFNNQMYVTIEADCIESANMYMEKHYTEPYSLMNTMFVPSYKACHYKRDGNKFSYFTERKRMNK